MEIEETLKKLKPIIGNRAGALWLEYQINPDSRRDTESFIRTLAEKYLGDSLDNKDIMLIPPPTEFVHGDYEFGRVIYRSRECGVFGLRESDWIQHVGIFGRTGSGKTNVGFVILKRLMEKGKPFLVFDWKRNYRDIVSWPGAKTKVYTVGRDISPFGFNPLIPPEGTPPTIWLKKVIEIMCHVYWLGEGVAYLLQKAIDEVYREKGVYEASGEWPTFSHVHDWLLKHKTKGRESQWMDSTLRVMGTLCFGEVGKVLNLPGSASPGQLLSKNVILELDTLSNSDKTFLIEALLLWIHHFRMQESTRETFKHAILIEEAHHVLLRRKESKESVMDIIVREIRELGEALIIIDQHPSLISIPALGNTHCTIAMNLKHARDVNAIGEAILLPEKDREFLGRTEVGIGIVKLQTRWTQPFLVKFPQMQITKGSVTDSMLKSNSAVSEPILPFQAEKAAILPIQAQDKMAVGEYRISDDSKRMLEDVMQHPTDGIASRYKRISFGVARGAAIVEALVTDNMLSSNVISTPEGRVRFLQLTEKGLEALKQEGVAIAERKRAGGPEHEYWKYRVAELLREKGYGVTVEKPIGQGRAVDVEARKSDVSIAVEVETGKSDVEGNLNKLIGIDFQDIWVLLIGNLPTPAIPPGLTRVNFIRTSEIDRILGY